MVIAFALCPIFSTDVASLITSYLRPYENALATYAARYTVIAFDDVNADDWPVNALGLLAGRYDQVLIIQSESDYAEVVEVDLVSVLESVDDETLADEYGNLSIGLGNYIYCLHEHVRQTLTLSKT
jgi:hypothetical protein